MSDDQLCLSCLMSLAVQEHRDIVVQAFADDYTEPCPVCEGQTYLGSAHGIPMREGDDDADDWVDEYILFVCAGCGTVFHTDELAMRRGGKITGRLVPIDDEGLTQVVQDAVNYHE